MSRRRAGQPQLSASATRMFLGRNLKRLAFPEAEKLALGKVTLEELRQSRN